MEVPVRFAQRLRSGRFLVLPALAVLLAGCAAVPQQSGFANLERQRVDFPSGRVTVVLTDEVGLPMARTRVDFAWERPSFYRTSGFTDSNGQITFSGVPELASLSINHPGGNYSSNLIVPQSSTSEMRVILDTYGENQATVNRLRRLQSPQ